MILPHDLNASSMRLPDNDATSERRRSSDASDASALSGPADAAAGSAVEWAPFDPGDSPDLPPTGDGSGRVVAVVAATELVRVGWAISGVIELARSWARERPGLVLVDTDMGRPRMHHTLGVDNAIGLAEILQGESPVGPATRTVVAERLYFVSAGNTLGAPELAFDADRWARFCRAFAEAGVTVVAYVPDHAPWAPDVLNSATDVIELREQDTEFGTPLPADTPVLAVLGPMPVGRKPIYRTGKEPPPTAPPLGVHTTVDEDPPYPTDQKASEVAPPPPPSDPRPAPGPTGSGNRRSGKQRSLVFTSGVIAGLLGVAAVLAVILRPGTGEDPASPGLGVGAGPDDAEGPPPADVRAIPSGLHFSLAVASYTDAERAESRAAQLASAVPEIAWYLAPVEIGGTVYQRVLGGFAPDSASGVSMAARVADRLGVNPQAWIVRRTDVVVDFGEETTLQGAEAQAARLRSLGIPAYVAEVTYSDRSIRWRIYSGGYAGEDEAAYLARTVASLGLPAEIGPRLGSP